MKFVYGILVFLALVVAALFLVPSFLDWEGFKPEITERLEAITGRTLAIDGPLKISILPTPTIEATDLRLANVPGAASPDMARIKSLDLKLALGPLLSGEIAVTGLAIDEPVIEFQRLTDGRPNWLFESAPGPATEGGTTEEAESGLELTRLDSATITNGTIVYHHADGRQAGADRGHRRNPLRPHARWTLPWRGQLFRARPAGRVSARDEHAGRRRHHADLDRGHLRRRTGPCVVRRHRARQWRHARVRRQCADRGGRLQRAVERA